VHAGINNSESIAPLQNLSSRSCRLRIITSEVAAPTKVPAQQKSESRRERERLGALAANAVIASGIAAESAVTRHPDDELNPRDSRLRTSIKNADAETARATSACATVRAETAATALAAVPASLTADSALLSRLTPPSFTPVSSVGGLEFRLEERQR
jgi:hypothetical protein